MSLARRQAAAALRQKIEADDYALLVLKNLHDSLKWIFTILMGGSAILAGQSLIIWADSAYSKYLGIPVTNVMNRISDNVPSNLKSWLTFLLFLIYSLTLFRFYWGWIRYCDVKYIEVPSLIASFREKFFDQGIPGDYEEAFERSSEYSRLQRVFLNSIPVFFQTTIIYIIAGSLNSIEVFVRTYIILMVFNSAYLAINYRLEAYHWDALMQAFGHDVARAITPREHIKIWIVNNFLCAVIMLALLEDMPLHSSLTSSAAFVFIFVMLANCAIDLRCTQDMYSRRVKILREVVGEF